MRAGEKGRAVERDSESEREIERKQSRNSLMAPLFPFLPLAPSVRKPLCSKKRTHLQGQTVNNSLVSAQPKSLRCRSAGEFYEGPCALQTCQR